MIQFLTDYNKFRQDFEQTSIYCLALSLSKQSRLKPDKIKAYFTETDPKEFDDDTLLHVLAMSTLVTKCGGLYFEDFQSTFGHAFDHFAGEKILTEVQCYFLILLWSNLFGVRSNRDYATVLSKELFSFVRRSNVDAVGAVLVAMVLSERFFMTNAEELVSLGALIGEKTKGEMRSGALKQILQDWGSANSKCLVFAAHSQLFGELAKQNWHAEGSDVCEGFVRSAVEHFETFLRGRSGSKNAHKPSVNSVTASLKVVEMGIAIGCAGDGKQMLFGALLAYGNLRVATLRTPKKRFPGESSVPDRLRVFQATAADLYSQLFSAVLAQARISSSEAIACVDVVVDHVLSQLALDVDENVVEAATSFVCNIMRVQLDFVLNDSQPSRPAQVEMRIMDRLSFLLTRNRQDTGGSDEEGRKRDEDGRRLVRLIGRIAIAMGDHADVVKSATSVLLSHLSRATATNEKSVRTVSTDSSIIEALADLAILGHTDVYNEVVALLINEAVNLYSPETLHLVSEVPRALVTLAKGLKSEALRDDFVGRLLNLFARVGRDVQLSAREAGVSVTSLAGKFGILLLALASVRREPEVKETSPQRQRLWRIMWFYLTAFGFVNEGTWLESWYKAVHDVAAISPVLVATQPTALLQAELQLNELLGSEREHISLRRSIVKLLPSVSNAERLPLGQVALLLSIFHLETMRVTRGSLESVFEYLEEAYEDADTIMSALRSIADEVFAKFLSSVDPGAVQDLSQLEQQVQALLVRFCHRGDNVHEAADKYVTVLVQKVPQLLWSRNCLTTLLSLLGILASSLVGDPVVDVVKVHPVNMFSLQLPDTREIRSRRLSELLRLARAWLRRATETHREEVRTAVDFTARHYPEIYRALPGGFGSEILLNVSMKTPFSSVSSGADKRQVWSKGFLTRLTQKAVADGVSEAVQDLIRLGGMISVESAQRKLAKMAVLELESLTEDSPPAALAESVFRAGATISRIRWQEGAGRDVQVGVVRTLVWLPAHVFRKDVAKACAAVWGWLGGVFPDLRPVMAAELANVFEHSVSQTLGMFSPSDFCLQRAGIEFKASSVEPMTPAFDAKNDPDVHGVMIKYLLSLLSNSPAALVSCTRVCVIGLSAGGSGCISTRAIPAFCRLLILGVHILARQVLESDVQGMLRSLITGGLVRLFSRAPTWWSHLNQVQAEGLCGLLSQLALKIEKAKIVFENVPGESDVADTSSSISASLGNEVTREASLNALSYGQSATRSRILARTGSRVLDTLEAGVAEKNPSVNVNSDEREAEPSAEAKKELFLLLLRNECERIILFLNPNDRTVKRMRSEATDRLVKKRLRVDYEDLGATCWRLSPTLAFFSALRFSETPFASAVRTNLVSEPGPLLGIGSAVPVFLRGLAALPGTLDESRLLPLAWWAPAQLSCCLEILSAIWPPPRAVVGYVLDCLDAEEPKKLVAYLPQLMQQLRYDHHDLWESFFLELGKSSMEVANSIIWCCQTEQDVEDFGSLPASSLPHRCYALRQELISSMSKRELDVYTATSSFYKKLQDISTNLLQVKRDLRKAQLRYDLSELAIPGDLRLPTALESVVDAIIPEASGPMKSHARVPILVTFAAQKVHGQAQELALRHACIFKAGDDCRQDQLAVQMVALFATVFAYHNLEILLYPYHVVPTGSGRGVIEVVRNARSRDQVGKIVDGTLLEYFIQTYGAQSSMAFQKARRNFLLSTAGYSLFSYILQVKDRHNGNIMLDEEGRVVHIDFGFMFDISPGGDIRFESAPFKLTQEMINLMGGKAKSEVFQLFVDVSCRGFLVLRQHMEEIISLVETMIDSELPCFKPHTMANLRSRFAPDKGDKAAVEFMVKRIWESFKSNYTKIYDAFQAFQNDIES